MEKEENYCYQLCQDVNKTEAFRELHRKIVNEIVNFCKNNDVEIDEIHLSADGIRGSIPFGEWTAGTDSSFVMYQFVEEHQRKQDTKPYFYSI